MTLFQEFKSRYPSNPDAVAKECAAALYRAFHRSIGRDLEFEQASETEQARYLDRAHRSLGGMA